MEGFRKLIIEVMYKADSCLPCFYMDEAVREILPRYKTRIEYRRVDITSSGKKRFLELCVSLFGEEGVYKHKRIAPIPSLFIDEELFFDAIPPRHDLEDAIREMLDRKDKVHNHEQV
ncbi:MAG: hypothetical protein GXP56_04805 [Deltaproteobacteria bacterium]|nr:hypothetical protein [Deltaproteobacteria bacterium]